jgi:hypothetical protein
MPRYVFTERDLEPLRALLELPLAHEALAAAVPIKRFDPPTHGGETIELPVAVLSRDNPDGVPLPEILARLKQDVPSVSGLVVRGDTVRVTYDQPPAKKDSAVVGKVLADRQALLDLRGSVVDKLPEHALEAVLTSDATPDAEWLGAFRRWAVSNVIKPG